MGRLGDRQGACRARAGVRAGPGSRQPRPQGQRRGSQGVLIALAGHGCRGVGRTGARKLEVVRPSPPLAPHLPAAPHPPTPTPCPAPSTAGSGDWLLAAVPLPAWRKGGAGQAEPGQQEGQGRAGRLPEAGEPVRTAPPGCPFRSARCQLAALRRGASAPVGHGRNAVPAAYTTPSRGTLSPLEASCCMGNSRLARHTGMVSGGPLWRSLWQAAWHIDPVRLPS